MKICAIMFTGCLLILLLAACGEESDLPDDPVEEEEEYDVVKYNYHINGYRSDFVDALGKVLGKPPGEGITKKELATLTRRQNTALVLPIAKCLKGTSRVSPLSR